MESVAAGIEDRDRSAGVTLLANVNPTFNWVRLAQRVPVRIALDRAERNELVAGATATVEVVGSALRSEATDPGPAPADWRVPERAKSGGRSCAYPSEAARSLRGEGGDGQVKDVKMALAHGSGSTLSNLPTGNLGTEEKL